MPLKDMALTPDEAKETMLGYTENDVSEAPKYPYGLSLDLNSEVLTKLGITNLPKIGEQMTITAIAEVTRVSAYKEQGGEDQCVGLQITQMDITGGQAPSAASKLYGQQVTQDD